MPSYNTAKYISNSIQSVLNQTYTNWELIIVDDCSTDNTDEIVSQFEDQRIRYLKNPVRSGAAVSRNYALREARGKWIAFLDSDDLWEPIKLERQLEFMKSNNYDFTYTDYQIIWDGTVRDKYVYTAPDFVDKKLIYRYCYFSTITVMYRRDVVGLIQIPPIKKNNDYAMWLKTIERANCYRLPECLSYYCKHQDSISGGSKWKLIKYHYLLFRMVVNYSPIYSVFCTLRNIWFGVNKKIKYKELADNYNKVRGKVE